MSKEQPHSEGPWRLLLLLAALASLVYYAWQASEPIGSRNSTTRAPQLAQFQGGQPPTTGFEEREESVLKSRRPPPRPRPEPPTATPTPVVAQPTPEPESPQARRYPKARPKPKSSPKPVAPKKVARVEQPAKRPHDPGDLNLGTGVSWDSLPSSGSTMNGYLTFEVGPGKAPAQKKIKRNLVVLIDVSGSMRMPVERIATPVILLMEKLGSEDRGAVVAFSDRAIVFASNTTMAGYKRSLEPLARARSTNLLVGLRAALREIEKGKGSGRTDQLVLLTDGLTSGGGNHHQQCAIACKEAGVAATVLGYGQSCNRSLLRSIADHSGGDFTYVYDVTQLLETVVGDVLGLSGIVTRNNRLVVRLKNGVRVTRAFLLGPGGRPLAEPRVIDGKLEIPLGDLREGETFQVALEVVLPSGEIGTLGLAEAQVLYDGPDGTPTSTSPTKVDLEYTDGGSRPRRNPKLGDLVPEIQKVERAARR